MKNDTVVARLQAFSCQLGLGAFLLMACGVWAQMVSAEGAPHPMIAQALSPNDRLERIAFGSCLHQAKPQPIWQGIASRNPQLMLMMGDNVYGDFDDEAATALKAAYAALAAHPEFSKARATLPMLATWDDHDYGRNDAGVEFAGKTVAAQAFAAFWGTGEAFPLDGGVYRSKIYGPAGQRVQIILLDTRSFRQPLTPKSVAFPHWGRFEPDPNPANTMLGDTQWHWLAQQLALPAEIRIIVSSIQIMAEGHGFERWGNMPAERDRLIAALTANVSGGLVLVSGDRHYGAMYASSGGRRELIEVTASALNMGSNNTSRDARISPLITDIVGTDNFGMIQIDWSARRIQLSLADSAGRDLVGTSIGF